MRRQVRQELYYRLARLLEEDTVTEGFHDMLDVDLKCTEQESHEAREFVLNKARAFFNKSGGG